MNRKIFLGFALIIFTTVSAFTQQYNAERDFEVRIINNGRAVEITKYIGTSRNVRIPPRIKNLPVTVIGQQAFAPWRLVRNVYDGPFEGFDVSGVVEEKQITGVTIPNGITEIGQFAFAFNQLTNVIIPNSVTKIGYGAFADNQLTNVTISNSVTSIDSFVFTGNRLSNVTIPNGVEFIGYMAFAHNQLTNVIIPNSVKEIWTGAFENNQLTNISIPNSVSRIGYQAFYKNKITSVIVPVNSTSVNGEEWWEFDDNSIHYAFDEGVSITKR